jgi:hypothetical protein
MANYSCAARTNYFRVKDVAAFRNWAERREIEVHAKEGDSERFCLSPGSSTDAGDFPSMDEHTTEDIDFLAELAPHLHPDSVAILMEAGSEKLRYLSAFAVAINAAGERVDVSLEDIYHLAAEKFPGKEITRAEY